MASYVMGDIHGGYRAVVQVLKAAPLVNGDELIFIGDYVDGWSQSFEVVQYLMLLREKYDCKFLMGNHDLWMRNWLTQGEKPKLWLDNGGRSAIESYNAATKKVKEMHAAFYQNLLHYYVDKEDRLFVHGGFVHERGVEFEDDFMVFITDRSLWKAAREHEFDLRFEAYTQIFIGHTPTLRMGAQKPVKIKNIQNVDTGAAFTGRLSLLDTHTFNVWQSDPLPQLYPNEKGRN